MKLVFPLGGKEQITLTIHKCWKTSTTKLEVFIRMIGFILGQVFWTGLKLCLVHIDLYIIINSSWTSIFCLTPSRNHGLFLFWFFQDFLLNFCYWICFWFVPIFCFLFCLLSLSESNCNVFLLIFCLYCYWIIDWFVLWSVCWLLWNLIW